MPSNTSSYVIHSSLHSLVASFPHSSLPFVYFYLFLYSPIHFPSLKPHPFTSWSLTSCYAIILPFGMSSPCTALIHPFPTILSLHIDPYQPQLYYRLFDFKHFSYSLIHAAPKFHLASIHHLSASLTFFWRYRRISRWCRVTDDILFTGGNNTSQTQIKHENINSYAAVGSSHRPRGNTYSTVSALLN